MRLMAFNEALVDLNKCLDIDVNYIKAYAKKGIYYTINIISFLPYCFKGVLEI